MAFNDIKYQSNFYNRFGKLVSVKLYEDGYSGATTNIRIQSVTIQVNYQDDTTPVIGTGAKVVFINEGSFGDYNDLLTAHEKQYKAIIEWDSTQVFEGFLVCDLNEQEFLEYSTITLQFTNYLRRLTNDYLAALQPVSSWATLIEIVVEALTSTGFEYDLYVNSSLFEVNMLQTAAMAWLAQTVVVNDIFYQNPQEYDNTYDVLNKILLPFGAFLYEYEEKWIIERYANISSDDYWVVHDFDSDGLLWNYTENLKVSYNKQDGDFDYIQTSQVIQYNSAYKEMILNLESYMFDTLVFNDFTVGMNTTSSSSPMAGTLTQNTWYIHEDDTDLAVGYNYEGINTYFTFTSADAFQPEAKGLYYAFTMQYNVENPTTLTVNFKMTVDDINISLMKTMTVRFFIKVNSGAKADWFLFEDADGVVDIQAAPINFEIDFEESADNLVYTFDVSKSLNLDTIWGDLGSPTDQDFIIGFLPVGVLTLGDVAGYAEINYIGDIQISVDAEAEDNEITIDLDETFLKTKEISLDLFDLNNWNYKNGLFLSNKTVKTNEWSDTGDSSGIPLVDIFTKDRYSKYNKTLKTLKATISCNSHIKPFSILTDDNLQDESSDDLVQFIITKYTWNLNNGTYNIEAEEYPETEIVISE